MNILDCRGIASVKCKINEPSDVTSVVDLLEENKSGQTCSFKSFELLNAEEQINLISLWLNTTLYPYVRRCNVEEAENLQNGLKKLCNIAIRIKGHAKGREKHPNSTNERFPQCGSCDANISLSNDNFSFWESLNAHNHIEENIVALIKQKNNKGIKEDSCVIEIEEVDNMAHSSNIRNYPPDVHYNFRFNFNQVPYHAPPMFVPVVNIVPNHVQSYCMAPAVVGSPLRHKIRPPNVILNQPPLPPPDYCRAVKYALYPNMKLTTSNNMYTLQIRNRKMFCLLCNVNIENSTIVNSHLYGKKHQRLANDSTHVEAVKHYHQYWMRQSDEMQMEQQIFDPISKNYVSCTFCKKPMSFDNIEQHLSSSSHFNAMNTNATINSNRRQATNDANDISDSVSDSTKYKLLR